VGCGAALAYRNRAPRGVLLFVFGCTLAYILIGYPKGPIFVALGVALYTALVSGHRRVAWFVLLAGYPSFVWLAHSIGRDPAPTLPSGPASPPPPPPPSRRPARRPWASCARSSTCCARRTRPRPCPPPPASSTSAGWCRGPRRRASR